MDINQIVKHAEFLDQKRNHYNNPTNILHPIQQKTFKN